MKILWYGQNPHYNSGMGRVGRELASYLSQYHDVHFFGQSVDGRPPEEKFGFTLYGNPFNDPTGDQMLNQYLSNIQPDALVTNLNYQQLQHVPQIVNSLRMQQNLDIPVFLHTAVETERAIPGFYEKVLGSYQTDAYLIPYNDAQIEMYEDSGDKRLLDSLTEAVPHGVDHNTYSPQVEPMGRNLLAERGIPDDAFTFLFVGENWRRKRIDKLCNAFSKVKEQTDKDVRLVLHTSAGPSRGDDFFAGWNVASGPGRGADPVLDQYGLDLGSDVHITKNHAAQFLPDQQMAGLYAASDAHILPTMGEGFGMCVAPDTDIVTDEGAKEMRNIETGDTVLTETGEYSSVKAKTERTVDEIYELTPWCRTSTLVTAEHPFLVTDESRYNIANGNGYDVEWRNVKDMSGDELLVTPRPSIGDSLPENMDVSQVVPDVEVRGDECFYSSGFSSKTDMSYSDIQEATGETKSVVEDAVQRYREGVDAATERQEIVVDFLEESEYSAPEPSTVKREIGVDEDFMRLCGWYLAEGSTGQEDSFVEFDLGAHESDCAEDISDLIQSVFDTSSTVSSLEDRNAVRVTCSSSIVAQFFSELFGTGAQNKRLPTEFMSSRSLPILETWMKGDGGVSGSRYTVSTTSKELLWQAWSILASGGVPCGVDVDSNNRDMPSDLDLYQLHLNRDALSTLNFDVEMPEDTERTGSYQIITDEHVLTPIRSIEHKDVEMSVMDINVEGTHSFVGNGITLHNTMLESMACGTPVITTDLSTCRWLCEDAAEYVEAEGEELMRMGEVLKTPSSDDMADKMLKVYNNDERRSEMVEKGLERASEFSWRKSGQMFNDVLQDRV